MVFDLPAPDARKIAPRPQLGRIGFFLFSPVFARNLTTIGRIHGRLQKSPDHGAGTIGPDFARADRPNPEELRPAIQKLTGLDCSPLELAPALLKLGSAKQEMGQHAEAEELFRKALDVSEQMLGPDDLRLVPALTSLGGVRILRGAPEEAEPFFTRALTISERQLGAEHPDLVILVNDLTRLYLKQEAYSCAEPLLQRLLTLKRSKGEDHPEVATVLASLAAVRQALGRHEAAEQLWRRVLDIRERTLAPNHFALVTALEHLADTCAARGKVREALELFKRGQAIRELTLGADHSSLRVSRERIADLQLQASEDFLDPRDTSARVSIPDSWRSITTEQRNIVPAPPNIVPAPPAHIRSAIVHGWNAVPVAEQERPIEAAIEDYGAPLEIEAAGRYEREPEMDAVQYRDFFQSLRDELESTHEPETLRDHAGVIASSVIELLRRQRREVVSVAGVLVILVVALASGSWASSDVELAAPEAPLSSSLPAVASASALQEPSDKRLMTAANAAFSAAKLNRTASAEKLTGPSSGSVDQGAGKPSKKRPSLVSAPLRPLLPGVTNHLDSVVGAVNAPVLTMGELAPIEPVSSIIEMPRPSFDDVESDGSQRVHARLIGDVPVPRYPEALSRSGVDGNVRVLFTVDTLGHPVMSTFTVEGSPDKLLTAAVRKVIPGMRFHPARSGAPESKPVVEMVHVRFRFARTN